MRLSNQQKSRRDETRMSGKRKVNEEECSQS